MNPPDGQVQARTPRGRRAQAAHGKPARWAGVEVDGGEQRA
jgi:hypothetical protein